MAVERGRGPGERVGVRGVEAPGATASAASATGPGGVELAAAVAEELDEHGVGVEQGDAVAAVPHAADGEPGGTERALGGERARERRRGRDLVVVRVVGLAPAAVEDEPPAGEVGPGGAGDLDALARVAAVVRGVDLVDPERRRGSVYGRSLREGAAGEVGIEDERVRVALDGGGAVVAGALVVVGRVGLVVGEERVEGRASGVGAGGPLARGLDVERVERADVERAARDVAAAAGAGRPARGRGPGGVEVGVSTRWGREGVGGKRCADAVGTGCGDRLGGMDGPAGRGGARRAFLVAI